MESWYSSKGERFCLASLLEESQHLGCSSKNKALISHFPFWCILCKNGGESIDRIILHCNFISYILNKVGEEFEVIGARPSSWHDLLGMEWQFIGNNKKSKMLWRCCLALSWCIWQERNARVFEDKSCEEAEVWSRIKLLASTWARASNIFGDLYISDLYFNWGAAIQ